MQSSLSNGPTFVGGQKECQDFLGDAAMQTRWVALDWAVSHAVLGHLDVRLETQLFYTHLRMNNHSWNIFSNIKLFVQNIITWCF